MHEWERQPAEPLLWYRRFTALRLMSPVRSIAAVYQQESKKDEKGRSNASGRWYDQARLWQWEARCAAFDAHQAKELEARIAAEKKQILSEGYALMHERVKTLNVLAKKLVSDIAKGKLYRTDVRSVGTGKEARQVDIELFDEGVIRELRACLADIASEMGERVKMTKQEITGANGKPLLPGHNELLAAMTDEEFKELKRLQDQALARLENGQQHGTGTTTDR